MDFEAERYLEEVGVGEINPNAVYIIVNSESGLLLEDVAPLLMKIESAYRRVFTLSHDKDLRDKLYKNLKNKVSLSGVSRAVNSRYRKNTYQNANKYEEWPSLTSKGRYLEDTHSDTKNIITRTEQPLVPKLYSEDYSKIDFFETKQTLPYRIELSRSKFSSPGFLEIFGDPNTLTQLIVLFGLWLSERRANQQQSQANLINWFTRRIYGWSPVQANRQVYDIKPVL